MYNSLGTKESALEIDVHYHVPFLLRDIDEILFRRDARVIHYDSNGPKLLPHKPYGRFNLSFVRYVDFTSHCVAAHGNNLVCYTLSPIPVSVPDGNVCAVLRERTANRGANTLSSSGHHSNSIFRICHKNTPQLDSCNSCHGG